MEHEQEPSNSYNIDTGGIDSNAVVEDNAECSSDDSEYLYQSETKKWTSITPLEVPSSSDVNKKPSVSFEKTRMRPASSCSSITYQNLWVSCSVMMMMMMSVQITTTTLTNKWKFSIMN